MAVVTYTKKSDGWYRGCGCGQKQADKLIVPEGSVELFINKPGSLVGPVTNQKYTIVPNTTSIDIRKEDEASLRAQGIAHDPIQGFLGALTRVAE